LKASRRNSSLSVAVVVDVRRSLLDYLIKTAIRVLLFNKLLMYYIIATIIKSVLRQVHSLFPSEFSREGDLVLPLSISSNFSFP
jgi:hypothetical protein